MTFDLRGGRRARTPVRKLWHVTNCAVISGAGKDHWGSQRRGWCLKVAALLFFTLLQITEKIITTTNIIIIAVTPIYFIKYLINNIILSIHS